MTRREKKECIKDLFQCLLFTLRPTLLITELVHWLFQARNKKRIILEVRDLLFYIHLFPSPPLKKPSSSLESINLAVIAVMIFIVLWSISFTYSHACLSREHLASFYLAVISKSTCLEDKHREENSRHGEEQTAQAFSPSKKLPRGKQTWSMSRSPCRQPSSMPYSSTRILPRYRKQEC